jgi:hypothetical protein
MDFKRDKSHKSKTSKEIVLTQEDKAKYTKLYDFLLQDSDNEDAITDDSTHKSKQKVQSSMNFRVSGTQIKESVDRYNIEFFQNSEQEVEESKK